MKNTIRLVLCLSLVYFANAGANEEKIAADTRDSGPRSEASVKSTEPGAQCELARIMELAESLASENCTTADETHFKRAESILCRPV